MNRNDYVIENTLNRLGILFAGRTHCVAIPRSMDLILNENGLTFSFYFHGNDISYQNVPDCNEVILVINVNFNECTKNFIMKAS